MTAIFKLGRIADVNITVLLTIILGYLIGSIPFGYLIARAKNIDILSQGSGNIGATNVFRLLGPLPGVIVFALDLSKGTVPVLITRQLTQNAWFVILAGIAALIGHSFPIFLKFKGGRGSATGLGILLAIAPDIFFGAMLLVILIILTTRYVSIASLVVPPLVAVAFFVLERPFPYTLAAFLVSVLIIARHIPNIKRLQAGTEPRIGGNQ